MGEGKLQALVYDILPLEEGAGKRCAECGEEGRGGGGGGVEVGGGGRGKGTLLAFVRYTVSLSWPLIRF